MNNNLCPETGLVSSYNASSIGDNMAGTIYLHNSPHHGTTTPPPIQLPPQTPLFDSLIEDINDTELLGTTTDSGLTPAMYNLWQSFASLFLPQSLALPPHLSPISLLSYSYISQQLRPFDLILIRTPGFAYNAMRSIIEHSYDHVAIVLTHNCALHISPPYTRIIPIASLIAPNRNPILLRPNLVIPRPSSIATSAPSLPPSTSQSPVSSPSTSQNPAPPLPQSPPQQPPISSPTFTPNPALSHSLFLQLLKLLGTPYDSLKMYTLWGKLALNRLINQPITKIDSTGVICTDAIMNILCQYDQLFTLSNIIKQWVVLHNHTRLRFNPRSPQAIEGSKSLNFPVKGILFGPNINPQHNALVNSHTVFISDTKMTTTPQYTFNKTATLLPIPQSLIHHQLPLSNLEMLSFTRLSAWSLNDLLSLSHAHIIYPNPQLHPVHALPTHLIGPQSSPDPNSDLYQSPTDLQSLPKHSPAKQFGQLVQKPLFIDAAFEVLLPPSQPIPITYLFPFCHQLSLMCANFVLRETTPSPPTHQPSTLQPSPPQLPDIAAPTTTSPPPSQTQISPTLNAPHKHSRQQLLKLVNPYHQPNPPSQTPQQPSPQTSSTIATTTTTTATTTIQSTSIQDESESEQMHALADSLYYYLICRLPGMTPLYLLQSMKLSLESLQKGKKYEIKPQVLLFDHPISHPALLQLSKEVNEMFQHIVLQPFLTSMKQAEERRMNQHLQRHLDHNFKNSQSLHHMASPSPQSFNLYEPPSLPPSTLRNEVIGQNQPPPSAHRTQPPTHTTPSQNIPSSLLSKSTSLNSSSSSQQPHLSPPSSTSIPDRLRNLFSQLTSFAHNLFSPQHITETNPDGLDPQLQSTLIANTNLSTDPNEHIKVDEESGRIISFPKWLKLLLPPDLLSKVTELVNIAISPGDGYREHLKTQKNKKNGAVIDITDIFINPRNDPNHPFPSIKYLSSIPTPFLLYLWSLLKPILRFYLILTLLSRLLPYLVYKLTASTLTALMAVPMNTISWAVNTTTPLQQQQPKGFFKRLLHHGKPPKPRLMATFRSRFLAFVYAVVAATVLRSLWNSSFLQSQLNTSTKTATQSVLTRIASHFNPRTPTPDNDDDGGGDDTSLTDPVERDLQEKRLQQLLPSNLLKEAQQIASGSTPAPALPGSISPSQSPSLSNPDSSLLISPTYTNRFLNAGAAPTNTVMSEITTLTRSLLDSYRTFVTPLPIPPTRPASPQTPTPPSPQLQTFLQRSDQSLSWLNEVLKATFYITTDTLGLRTMSKRFSNSRSMKEIQRQIGNIRGQLNGSNSGRL